MSAHKNDGKYEIVKLASWNDGNVSSRERIALAGVMDSFGQELGETGGLRQHGMTGRRYEVYTGDDYAVFSIDAVEKERRGITEDGYDTVVVRDGSIVTRLTTLSVMGTKKIDRKTFVVDVTRRLEANFGNAVCRFSKDTKVLLVTTSETYSEKNRATHLVFQRRTEDVTDRLHDYIGRLAEAAGAVPPTKMAAVLAEYRAEFAKNTKNKRP